MRYGIMGIPTLIYFKGGEEVDRVVGVTSYGTLKNKLERLVALDPDHPRLTLRHQRTAGGRDRPRGETR